MNLTRRALFGGFAGLLAAPAIVKASSLMTVKPLPAPDLRLDFAQIPWRPHQAFHIVNMTTPDLTANVRVFVRLIGEPAWSATECPVTFLEDGRFMFRVPEDLTPR